MEYIICKNYGRHLIDWRKLFGIFTIMLFLMIIMSLLYSITVVRYVIIIVVLVYIIYKRKLIMDKANMFLKKKNL